MGYSKIGRPALRFFAFGILFASQTVSVKASDDGASAGSLAGAIRADYFRSTKTLDDATDIFGAIVQLKGQYQFAQQVGGKLRLRIGTGDLVHDGKSYMKATEAYADVKGGTVDLRVGKQIVAWGRTDALNPTDVVTPRDYTTLLPFDDDQRSGIWGALVKYYFDPATSLSAFVSPDFKPSIVPFPATGGRNFIFETPGRTWDRGQSGLRLNNAGGELDWSISAFHGHSLLPQADRTDTLAGGSRLTHMGYPVISMLGADLAKNFGRYGFRFEGAYIRPEGATQSTPTGLRSNLYLVAGVDRSFLSHLNVNFQLTGRWSNGQPWNKFSDANDRDIARINGFTFTQLRSQTFGYTMRVANSWRNETLEAELFVQHYFANGGTYIQPMIKYAIDDNTSFTVGAQLYFGNDDSYFGMEKKNRNVFSELRYSF